MVEKKIRQIANRQNMSYDGGLLQAVDIYRSNSKEDVQKVAENWYDKGYLVEYEFQRNAYEQGRYVLIAFVISRKKNIFQKSIDVDVVL